MASDPRHWWNGELRRLRRRDIYLHQRDGRYVLEALSGGKDGRSRWSQPMTEQEALELAGRWQQGQPGWREVGGALGRTVDELHRWHSSVNSPMPVSLANVGRVKIRGALETPDGQWRVEVVQDRGQVFYRLIHGDNVDEGLAIATLQRLLAEAGVDMADLVEAPIEPAT